MHPRFKVTAGPNLTAWGSTAVPYTPHVSRHICPPLPLVFPSGSDIRSTMVKMFAANSSASVRYLNTGDCSSTEQRLDTIVPAGGRLPVDPSTCVFWSAVALGSLVKGRPLESVRNSVHSCFSTVFSRGMMVWWFGGIRAVGHTARCKGLKILNQPINQ